MNCILIFKAGYFFQDVSEQEVTDLMKKVEQEGCTFEIIEIKSQQEVIK